jgi:hypothetical protein
MLISSEGQAALLPAFGSMLLMTGASIFNQIAEEAGRRHLLSVRESLHIAICDPFLSIRRSGIGAIVIR